MGKLLDILTRKNTTEEDKLSDHGVRNLNRTLQFLSVLIVGTLGYTTYLLLEPDPLEVDYAHGSTKWSNCNEREFTLSRYVKSDKDLTIFVKEYWSEVDGMLNIDGTMLGEDSEYPHKPLSVYSISAGTKRNFTFPKHVPKQLEVGRYMYRPHAEYKVNFLKTIHRDLPVQFVDVTCTYNKDKHGAME